MNNFIRLSKYAGMREDLVQAGGGNSAYKITPEKMAIKASGYQLADINEKVGFALVNPKIIREAFLENKNLDDMTENESKSILSEAFIEGDRPSIETFLHSISGRYSLHTHPIVVNALTCRKKGRQVIMELFPDALVVPYATPGVKLAKAYFKEYRKYMNQHESEPDKVFLMNHGLLVSAETADEVLSLTEAVTRKIEDYLNVDMHSYHELTRLMSLYDDGVLWKVTDKNVLDIYRNMRHFWNHCFCPDCVVFLGKQMLKYSGNKEEFDSFVELNGYPSVLAYMNNLYIHADSVKKALETQSVLSFSAQVMSINSREECNLLSENEKNFLLNWDAEKYRKNMK